MTGLIGERAAFANTFARTTCRVYHAKPASRTSNTPGTGVLIDRHLVLPAAHVGLLTVPLGQLARRGPAPATSDVQFDEQAGCDAKRFQIARIVEIGLDLTRPDDGRAEDVR